MKLSEAQKKALEKFRYGHSYGEGCHLTRATARALALKGLVVLGTRKVSAARRIAFGFLTEEGARILTGISGLPAKANRSADLISYEESQEAWAAFVSDRSKI